MASCEDLIFEVADSRDYRKVANDVIKAVENEPNYGKMVPESVAEQWRTFEAVGMGEVFVAKLGDRYVGSLFGLCSRDPLTAEIYGIAYAWLVGREYRAGGTARKLREMFEEWAVENGAVALKVGVHNSPWADKQIEARKRDGYVLEAYSFTKKV